MLSLQSTMTLQLAGLRMLRMLWGVRGLNSWYIPKHSELEPSTFSKTITPTVAVCTWPTITESTNIAVNDWLLSKFTSCLLLLKSLAPRKGRPSFKDSTVPLGSRKVTTSSYVCQGLFLCCDAILLTVKGFIFAGALFGFTLARLMYLNVSGVSCGPDAGANHAAPGECYYYQNFDRYKIGIRLHLYTVLRKQCLVFSGLVRD